MTRWHVQQLLAFLFLLLIVCLWALLAFTSLPVWAAPVILVGVSAVVGLVWRPF